MKNYITIKLQRLFFWALKHLIKDIYFEMYEHHFFVSNKAWKIYIEDFTGNYWHYAFGKLKPEMRTYSVGKRTFINALGGMSWEKVFADWFCCYYRDNKLKY